MATTTLIGLDIGSTAVRAVETGRGRSGPSLVRSGAAPLPPGAVRGGVVQDDKAVTQALRHLWSTAGFRSRKVVLGVTSPQVVVRDTTVPDLPAAQRRAALPLQVRDPLPLPLEESVLDFHPLAEPDADRQVRGMLIAAPKQTLLTAVHAAERAGLHVARVDLAAFALVRGVSWLDGRVEAIVDIGDHITSMIVHEDGVPLIVRALPRGGAEITAAIAARLGISAADAEDLKRRAGLDAADPAAAEAVEAAVTPLAREIHSSFAYLSAGERNVQVGRLVLAGGGAALPGLARTLGAQLRLDVRYADPAVRLRGAADRSRRGQDALENLDRFGPAAAIAVGLTLGVTS
ncbi:type IV pilus assembly protein PilM [Spirillospora albida]|uniref:type IV pilus assembly protein PilM n=1 Tax=Spirillospora albida TaxID=58123 RepID=UPI0004BE9DEA|nr:type IV pilus assembly protein PilM [Spirillospora albida]